MVSRISQVPLIYPHCGGPMRIIALITFSADIHKILEYIGGSHPKLPASPRHAGQRCGMTVVRKNLGRVWMLCRTGI